MPLKPGHTSNISILKLYAALSGLEDTESNMNGCTFVEARKRLMQRSLLRPVGRELRRRFKMGNCAPRIQGIRMMQMERRYQCFVLNQGCECASERLIYMAYTNILCVNSWSEFIAASFLPPGPSKSGTAVFLALAREEARRLSTLPAQVPTWPNMMSVGTYKQAVH